MRTLADLIAFNEAHADQELRFIGGRFTEPTLIKLADGFEQGTRVRHAPRYLPSLAVRDFIARDTNAHTGRRTGTEPSKSQQKLAGL